MTGAVVFLVAIGAAFTGYLSQQNFDSQWIASEGKDGLNSVGIGAYFNVVDFGQMYTFHVILLPVVVVALVVWHVLLVRRHGVVPPYPARVGRSPARERGRGAERTRERLERAGAPAPATRVEREWHGEYVRYDLIKEFVVALAVITALAVDPRDPLLLSRRQADDDPEWARADPGDFVATAVTELDGTSEMATYGPPYNDTPASAQKVWPVSPADLAGVHYRIDTAKDFVLDPLREHPGERDA